MQVTTRMIDDEQYESFNASGMSITIDMRPDGARKRQNPPELLLSALTACASVDIVGILKKRRKNVLDFNMVTHGTRRDDYPRAFTTIHCEFVMTSPDVTEEDLLKAAALSIEKYCTVAASLKSTITWSARIIAPERI
jgi:putative redox protein